MNKRDIYLKTVTLEHAKHGFLKNPPSDEGARVSIAAHKTAAFQGSQIRDKIYRKHRVWELQDANQKVRDKIKRALSCGDTLDEPENLELLKELKRTKEATDLAGDAAQKECEELTLLILT